MAYEAPFTITNQMLNLVSEITGKIGSIKQHNSLDKLPRLRKQNRIRSVYSSCAIEANSLSIDNVSSLINGQTVIGPQKEIQEVLNAIEAYEIIETIDPFSINDLLKVHSIISNKLLIDSGSFRNNEEGVFDGDTCIFMAPPSKLVPDLMTDLFDWLKRNRDVIHPLILSSVFHYEFVFIHPFSDGNGRVARFFQNAILGKSNPLFYWLPIENYIKDYQNEYYQAISKSHKAGESTDFIIFMLEMINKTIDNVKENINIHESHLSNYVSKLLIVLQNQVYLSASEIMLELGLKSKETFRKNYLNPAIEAGLVAMEYPDKPTSKNQRYIIK